MGSIIIGIVKSILAFGKNTGLVLAMIALVVYLALLIPKTHVANGSAGSLAATNLQFNQSLGENSTNSYIYCVGDSGYGNENLSYYAQISANGIGEWTQTTSYPVGVDDVGCDIYGNHIYCIGTNDTMSENETFYARISANGIGNWTAGTPYPVPTTYQSCSAYRGYIYCVGNWKIPSNDSYYTKILKNGSIGGWNGTTRYPIPFYWGSCSINNGYIYCVGGPDVSHYPGEADSQVINSSNKNYSLTYFAAVSSSGIGKWTQTTPFPSKFFLNGCSVYNNYIYCIGGEPSTGNAHYAPLSENGIGSWMNTTSLPIDNEQGGCAIHLGYIYCVGSRDPTSAHHQVWYAKIMNGGGIGNWTESTPYPIPVYGDSYCEIPGSGGSFTGGGGPEN